MIFTVDELSGKALDYAYEEALNSDMRDVKIVDGLMFIYLVEDYCTGWYQYRRRFDDEHTAKDFLRSKKIIHCWVPNELIDSKYIDKRHV